jgi:hypothetical protein
MSFQKTKTEKVEKRTSAKRNNNDTVMADISNAIEEVRHGSVQIHIQDGKIVQIDTINKIRLR